MWGTLDSQTTEGPGKGLLLEGQWLSRNRIAVARHYVTKEHLVLGTENSWTMWAKAVSVRLRFYPECRGGGKS